jgi:hypothetical protein
MDSMRDVDPVALLQSLTPEQVTHKIAELQQQLQAWKTIAKVVGVTGKKRAKPAAAATAPDLAPAEGPSDKELESLIRAQLVAAGPQTLGELSRGVGKHHITVKRVIERMSGIRARDGKYSLPTA